MSHLLSLSQLLARAGLAAAFFAATCTQAAPWSFTPGKPLPAGAVFPTPPDAAALKRACEKGLAEGPKRVRALEQRKVDARWLAAADDLVAFVEDASGPLAFLSAVHPDKTMRDAAEACELRWQDFQSSLSQNQKLLAAAKKVKPRDTIDAQNLRLMMEGFEDAGATLSPEKRKRAKAIADKLTELGQSFERNVRDDGTQVPFTEAELEGVPAEVWKSAPKDAQGRILLRLESPVSGPVLSQASNAATRERMWRARINQGGEVNLGLLDQITELRRELAGLFGLQSYADYILRRRMAGTEAAVLGFLKQVHQAVAQRERDDLEDLVRAKSMHLGTPMQDTHIKRWDERYYSERLLRERHALDQESFRPFFPPQESLLWVMRLSEQLFGVRYERIKGSPQQLGLWHEQVQAWRAVDAQSGKPLAQLLVDLYPREGKYNHAAVWSYQSGATRNGRLPAAALVVNFDRKGLTIDELETLLHEFGHALHSNLSATRYAAQAGTSTLRDFVEAPSQMLEDWVYDPRALALMQQVCASCKPVPAELLQRATAARDHGKGLRVARQHMYASFDMALHAAKPVPAKGTWAQIESATPVGHEPGSYMASNFGHIASGYAAGYYGYLWSEVAARDMRTAFDADRMSASVGRRYRNAVLAGGGQRPPNELLQAFLGRPSNAQAFFEYLNR